MWNNPQTLFVGNYFMNTSCCSFLNNRILTAIPTNKGKDTSALRNSCYFALKSRPKDAEMTHKFEWLLAKRSKERRNPMSGTGLFGGMSAAPVNLEARKPYAALEAEVAALAARAKKAERAAVMQRRQVVTLEKNISVLYKTAVGETDRLRALLGEERARREASDAEVARMRR